MSKSFTLWWNSRSTSCIIQRHLSRSSYTWNKFSLNKGRQCYIIQSHKSKNFTLWWNSRRTSCVIQRYASKSCYRLYNFCLNQEGRQCYIIESHKLWVKAAYCDETQGRHVSYNVIQVKAVIDEIKKIKKIKPQEGRQCYIIESQKWWVKAAYCDETQEARQVL